MSAKRAVKWIFDRVAPGVSNRRYLEQHAGTETELKLLPALVDPGSIAVDVGANRGLYVHHLRKITPHVVAFEPLPPMQAWLRRNYPTLDLRPVALSDHAGSATIRFPRHNYSWATLAPSNDLDMADEAIESVEVPMRTLDSFGLTGVGFLKVDVEGFEESVLHGAAETLRQGPSVLVEVEERHNPGSTRRVPEYLAQFGYRGFFVSNRRLVPVEQFDPATDAPIDHVGKGGKSGRYINNFIFLSASRAGEQVVRAEQCLR